MPARASGLPAFALESRGSTDLALRLSRLYRLSSESRHLFGSPLGPFPRHGLAYSVPRFFSCGPDTSDTSIRLAFLSGYAASDARLSDAVLHFVEALMVEPVLGSGLHLSFFPIVNPVGVERGTQDNGEGIDLRREHWAFSRAPEIQLLQRDARTHHYHGFLQVVGTDTAMPTACLRWADPATSGSGEDLLTAGVTPWGVTWQLAQPGESRDGGPLSISADFVQRSFEITLGIPESWSTAQCRSEVPALLRHFILSYRSTLAVGQYL